MSYGQIRKATWDKIPENMKVNFPIKVSDYINKYQNITLQKAWKVFQNPDEYNKFTFMRRIIRATWTANYTSSDIWIKGS